MRNREYVFSKESLMMMLRGFILLFIIMFMFVGIGWSQKRLGEYRYWNLWSYNETGGDVCTLWSEPRKSAGKYTRRGGVYFHIASRSVTGGGYEISLSMGYPVKADTEVLVTIDKKKKYSFYITDEVAFLAAAKVDGMLSSMRDGERLVVEGVSKRGTKTRDDFSLVGVTAGLKALRDKC